VIATSISDVIAAWPLAFLLGVVVGLVLSNRGYRIVREKRNGKGEEEV
jgi:hypothetical protein